MFNIKNIVSKITERGKESQPNSPARMGHDDDKLSKQGAEGFLCPKCMMALPTPEELQSHYETIHDSDQDQNSPDASTSSSGVGFFGLHQEVGEHYSRNRQDVNLINEKLIAEVHGITEISELHKSLMDALESKHQLQLEKEQLEHKTAELAQANASMKANTEAELGKQTALNERLKIVEAQLAHRESIDDAAVLRQELVQVQRVMDKMTREREGERDELQSERDELVSKVLELTDQLTLSKSKNDEHLNREQLECTQAECTKAKNQVILLHKKTETLENETEQNRIEIEELRSQLLLVISQRDELNNRLDSKEMEEHVTIVAATATLEATPIGTSPLLDQSADTNAGKSADVQEELCILTKHMMNAEENEKTDLENKIEELKLQLETECQNSVRYKIKIDAFENTVQVLTHKLEHTQDKLKESNLKFQESEIVTRNSHEVLVEKDLMVEIIKEENIKLKEEIETLKQSLIDSQASLTSYMHEFAESETKLANIEESNFQLHKSLAGAYLDMERIKDDTSAQLSELSAINLDMENSVSLVQQEMSRLIYEQQKELKDIKYAHEKTLIEYEKQKMSMLQIQRENRAAIEELKKNVRELEDKLHGKEKTIAQGKEEMDKMELKYKAALNQLETTAASDNETNLKTINKLQGSLDEITGEKLALEALLETSQTEQKSLLEKFYQSCNDNESQRRSVDDVRRRLEDSQSALHELGRENQILQLELEKLLGRKWTEDADAAQCKLCSKEFSLIVRKHHCRNCGQIFCSECSNKMAPLANNKKPVRVCDSCYNELALK